MTMPRANQFKELPFPFPIVTPREMGVPEMLPDSGPLMKLWRADPAAEHLMPVEFHVGFDLEAVLVATMTQPRLVAHPKELPA